MRILVTGGAGYIGGTVASLLAAKGTNRQSSTTSVTARREMVPAGVELVEGDLADRGLIEKHFQGGQERRTALSTACCTSPR